MKQMLIVLILFSYLFAASVDISSWKKDETFSDYLLRNKVPLSLLKTISAEDMKYLSEIQSGEKFYEMKDGDVLLQALIPIGEEMQIKIYNDPANGKYGFDIVPIVYKVVKDEVLLSIHSNCYSDIDAITGYPRLGFALKTMYGDSLNFRRLIKGDRIAFSYTQKSRLGIPFGQPVINAAIVKTRSRKLFVYTDKDGNIWNDIVKKIRYKQNGKREVEYTIKKVRYSGRFIMPVKHARITSRFTYKRWHPILHKYRPHLGVDWGARKGTPVYATNSGKILFAGWMRGYGKVVKIKHRGDYISLYAHLSKIRVRRGDYVKRGRVVGNVGSTGRSTGPHLHYGLYRRGRAINPLKVLGRGSSGKEVTLKRKKIESYSVVKTKTVPIKGAKRAYKRLAAMLKKAPDKIYRWEKIDGTYVYISDRKRYARRTIAGREKDGS